MTPQSREKTAKTAVFQHRWQAWIVVRPGSRLYASTQGRHETGGVLSLFFLRLSFDISIKNSVQRWSSDFQGLFHVKIRKMAMGSNDLSTLPLKIMVTKNYMQPQICHVEIVFSSSNICTNTTAHAHDEKKKPSTNGSHKSPTNSFRRNPTSLSRVSIYFTVVRDRWKRKELSRDRETGLSHLPHTHTHTHKDVVCSIK